MIIFDFDKILQDFWETEETKHEPRQIGIYYASNLGSECQRQTYLRYKIEKPHETFTLGTFEIGNLVHDWLAKVFKQYGEKTGLKTQTEKKVPPLHLANLEIRGRTDLIINNQLVVDFKTISPNAFKHSSLPYSHHTAQLNFYLNRLKINNGTILYVDKYALRLEPYPITYDPQLFNYHVNLTQILHINLTQNRPPNRCPVYPDKYPCTYCDRKTECTQLPEA